MVGVPGESGRQRILVVEDDVLVSEIMEVLLEQLGYETLAVGNARAAREALSEDARIGAIFADLGLPDAETGERLLSWVANRRPEVLRVLMSGVKLEEDELGDYVFLLKPFGKQRVLEALAEAQSNQQLEPSRDQEKV